MSILSLKETISSFAEDLSDELTDLFAGNSAPFPEFTPLTPKLERGKAFKVYPYAFRVVPTGVDLPFIGSSFTLGGSGGPDAPFRKLKLNLNPQSINLDETYAINLVPTEGGVVREHNGLILRDLVITGTTGMNPDRGTQGLTEGVESGYEAIHRLVNYFRSYSEKMKIDPSFRKSQQLVFINRKDSEELVVEPVVISRRKSVPRSTLYEYSLRFKVIGPFEPTFPFPPRLQSILNGLESFGNIVNDVYYKLQKAKGILTLSENFMKNVSADVVSTILEPLKQVSSFLQALGGFNQTLIDLPSNIYKEIKSKGTSQLNQIKVQTKIVKKQGTLFKKGLTNLPNKFKKTKSFNELSGPSQSKYKNTDVEKEENATTTQLNPDDNLGAFLTGEGVSVEDALSVDINEFLTPAQQLQMAELLQENSEIQVDQIEDLITNIDDFSNLLSQSANLSDSDFVEFLEGENTTIEPATNKLPTDEEIDILNALEEVKLQLLYLLGAPELFAEDPSVANQQVSDAFGGNIVIQQGSSIQAVGVDAGQSIVDLAAIYLGDALAWPNIVQLNNLKPPFIVDDINSTLKGVLKPGDTVLIPLNSPSGVPSAEVLKKLPINSNLNALERFLGVDLAVDESGDLVIANSDFKLVAGMDCALQGLSLKFRTTPGELKYHRGYGFPLEVGEKRTDITSTDVFDAVFNTITTDDRFNNVRNLQVNFRDGTVTVVAKASTKMGNLPVPLVLRF